MHGCIELPHCKPVESNWTSCQLLNPTGPKFIPGNPLQYSCLENSKDRGAWWAAVPEVTASRTCLSNWHFLPLSPKHLLTHFLTSISGSHTSLVFETLNLHTIPTCLSLPAHPPDQSLGHTARTSPPAISHFSGSGLHSPTWFKDSSSVLPISSILFKEAGQSVREDSLCYVPAVIRTFSSSCHGPNQVGIAHPCISGPPPYGATSLSSLISHISSTSTNTVAHCSSKWSVHMAWCLLLMLLLQLASPPPQFSLWKVSSSFKASLKFHTAYKKIIFLLTQQNVLTSPLSPFNSSYASLMLLTHVHLRPWSWHLPW